MTPSLELVLSPAGRGQSLMRFLPSDHDRQSGSSPVRSLSRIVFCQAVKGIFSDAYIIGLVTAAQDVAVVQRGCLFGAPRQARDTKCFASVPLDKLGTPNASHLVEAAGVEPASENLTGLETTCLARSRFPPSRETFAGRAQNGQETRTASLVVSPPAPRRSARDQPAMRRPSAAHGRGHGGRLLN